MNNYYIYVYCNPLKQGKYNYMINNITIQFDYEPFYIGMRKNNRLQNNLDYIKTYEAHNYKEYTIKKILNNNHIGI